MRCSNVIHRLHEGALAGIFDEMRRICGQRAGISGRAPSLMCERSQHPSHSCTEPDPIYILQISEGFERPQRAGPECFIVGLRQSAGVPHAGLFTSPMDARQEAWASSSSLTAGAPACGRYTHPHIQRERERLPPVSFRMKLRPFMKLIGARTGSNTWRAGCVILLDSRYTVSSVS
jgi:hypothetical protein